MPVGKKYLITDIGRECSYCNVFKPWSEFGLSKGKPYDHKSRCKKCRRKLKDKPTGRTDCKIDAFGRECTICRQYKEWDAFGDFSAGVNRHRSQCKECFSILQKKYRYNLPKRQYLLLIETANGHCQICKRRKVLVVDHCHKQEKVRGLLCNECNKAIGLLDDSVYLLNSLIEYLDSGGKIKPNRDREYPKASREIDLFRRYGITEGEYQRLLDSQDSRCAICSSVESSNGRLAVDHCHITGMIRGLLCTRCNSAIGQFCDSKTFILSAIQYLERSGYEFSRH